MYYCNGPNSHGLQELDLVLVVLLLQVGHHDFNGALIELDLRQLALAVRPSPREREYEIRRGRSSPPPRSSMASTCLLSLVIVVSGSAGDRPALRHASRAQLVAQGQGAGWLSALTEAPGWAQHDYANLVVLPLLSGLTFAALRTERAHLPLATLLLAYMALDALWMVVHPSVVKVPQPLLKAA